MDSDGYENYLFQQAHNMDKFVCQHCLDNIGYNIMFTFLEIVFEFLDLQYSNNDHKNNIKYGDIVGSTDFAWSIVSPNRLVELFLALNCDAATMMHYKKNDRFMLMGRDKFAKYLDDLRHKCEGTPYSNVLPNADNLMFYH